MIHTPGAVGGGRDGSALQSFRGPDHTGNTGRPSLILYPEMSSGTGRGTGRMGLGSNPPSSLRRPYFNWNAARAANGIEILYSVRGVNPSRYSGESLVNWHFSKSPGGIQSVPAEWLFVLARLFLGSCRFCSRC